MKGLKLLGRCTLWSVLAVVVFLWFFQERLMYMPRPYDDGALLDLQHQGGRRLEVHTSQGKQVAFYLPPRSGKPPEALWFVFGGNGSLSLDYMNEPPAWDPRFGYVFVDYPGYGLCEGAPNPDRIAETVVALSPVVTHELGWSTEDLRARAGVFGHSMGAAAGLIAAEKLGLRRLVLCAPFTTMMAMARRTVGWPLCYLNRHPFDNVARLAALSAAGAQVRIFHGTADEVIPVEMGKALAAAFPQSVKLTIVEGSHHYEIVLDAQKQIGEAMLELSGLR